MKARKKKNKDVRWMRRLLKIDSIFFVEKAGSHTVKRR